MEALISRRNQLADQLEVLNQRIDVLENSFRTPEQRIELKSLIEARVKVSIPFYKAQYEINYNLSQEVYQIKNYENWMN